MRVLVTRSVTTATSPARYRAAPGRAVIVSPERNHVGVVNAAPPVPRSGMWQSWHCTPSRANRLAFHSL